MCFAIVDIASTHSTGYSPLAHSPESIIQLLLSYTAFATSLTSALVGLGLCVIDSSICVAVITGLPVLLHNLINLFCTTGTSSIGISTPISPRATIIPSESSSISSIFSTPSWLSIFEIIFISCPPLSSNNFLICLTSSGLLINEAKM